jgi:hypothetical protein
MADTFQEFIASERQRLHAERDAVFTEQQQLETKLDEINRELMAIDAYESAKTGKTASGRQSGNARMPRARKGSKREELIAVIKDSAQGMTRGEILEKMGLKGNKSGEMSVSNALTALTKANQVLRRDGRYVVGS